MNEELKYEEAMAQLEAIVRKIPRSDLLSSVVINSRRQSRNY